MRGLAGALGQSKEATLPTAPPLTNLSPVKSTPYTAT